jgi:hypothetical protein
LRGGPRCSLATGNTRRCHRASGLVASRTSTSPTTPAEEAALLGQTVDPREHRSYAEIACLAPCVICSKEGASEEEVEEQELRDKFGCCGIAGEELSEGSGNHPKKGGGPSEGGGGEASSREWQRVRNKGKCDDCARLSLAGTLL